MKIYTFITTYSNQKAKFDTVAYPIQLRNHLNLVEQKTNYNKDIEFSAQDAPAKFITFQQGAHKFYAKVIFLGSQGTNDRRGGNYLATTIAIDKNYSVNPAQFFLEDSFWKSELTEEEDLKFKRDSNLLTENISLPENKYFFLESHFNELRKYSSDLIYLISAFLKRDDNNILVNSQRQNYSKLLFFLCDILPDAFTAELSLSLHPNDIDREVAVFVETIEYSDKKLMTYNKIFSIIDFFNPTTENEELQLKEKYLIFLDEVFFGDEAGLLKVKIFNTLYENMLFSSHNLSSLGTNLEIMSGNIEVLFERQEEYSSIPVDIVCSLLFDNKLISASQCLTAYLKHSTVSPSALLNSFIDFVGVFANKGYFSLKTAIKIYEENHDLSETGIRQLIINSHLDKQIFDADVSEYLLLRLSQLSASKHYEDMLKFLNITRPDVFETPPLSDLWGDYEIKEKILTADNARAILFFFEELLSNGSKLSTVDNDTVFRVLKAGLKKPWKAEHLEILLNALYKKIFQKASIAEFIHGFLEYVQLNQDKHTPSAEFILRSIINQVIEKDNRLLFSLCRQLGQSDFLDVLESELKNRLTEDKANSLLYPVGQIN